ncbi:DUF5130 family protein [Frankia sp. Cppng1_Ct_nod]|uniref:DUF5130 family protein n=1 Tax=Frankia sp. Cppng1_Ct_nod TaxID=2897162 RepID=UPI0020240D0E|nr:DUF5130 family protein [Frankia sp. Cppng1_Ct_nod]
MVRGEAFTHDQLDRLDRARVAAEIQTGVRFAVRVGEVDGDADRFAEEALANLVDLPRNPAVLVLVSPGQRFTQIMTTLGAKSRITDQAAGLAVLTMTSSFALGDLVGGIVNGLRQLADAAGPPAPASPHVVAPPVPPAPTEPTGTR